MQQGKGRGYERWAKSFNLKQMAQTVLYLQEHNLLDYEELSQKAASVKDQFNQLSTQIKDAEHRMAEISVMRKHIINYAKTREIYAGYRRAGYSKKFLAEHETDILLHKAAKKYFDENEDVVKEMEKLAFYARVATIRNKQKAEHKIIEQNYKKKEEKLDIMMDVDM